ncbi:toxic anion resistance protein [Pseudomonadales bacterium]|nr:toxic anion resistance protein [Pseudomonadales bacterium]MDA9064406.1 toxic anion resistance protein [Pseudomonadales bacterium]MDB4068928.1 toxic anion resistance protein [Pseudomonadales bacterium]MDB4150239.1 toxic anion resistance protein [Pseudomonadales bacterium]MDB9866869.1 toxic anion resistance protein [Pseudomonadales bacterium]
MTTEVTPPKWALEKDLSTLKDRTLALVQSTKEKSGPALSRIVAGIGEASQKKMSSANDLMAGSVGTLLKGLDGKSPTGEKLLELRSAMDDLNPHSLSNSWWFAWMPKGVKRKAISRFINRYQPMQAHLNGIFDGLRNGKDELLETSIALEEQYDEIAAAKKEMEAEIYVGELFIKQVEELEAVIDTDPRELQKLGAVKNQAMRRIRDIRTMEQAAVQFFISIDQTVATNSLLGEQIDSALVVGPMVMSNALRIQAALAQQDSVREAVESVQNAMGDMMAQNAAAVNQAAQKVGDMYNNPVIGLEKLEEGFDQLMQAVNTANATIATSTIKARETSDRLAQMTAELEPVAAGMRDARAEGAAQEPVLSLESGNSEPAVRGSND